VRSALISAASLFLFLYTRLDLSTTRPRFSGETIPPILILGNRPHDFNLTCMIDVSMHRPGQLDHITRPVALAVLSRRIVQAARYLLHFARRTGLRSCRQTPGHVRKPMVQGHLRQLSTPGTGLALTWRGSRRPGLSSPGRVGRIMGRKSHERCSTGLDC
jgi:hypothetical protein